MSEKTINDVTRPMIDIEVIDSMLDAIKSAVEHNDRCDDVNIGMRMGLLQAYTIISDAIIIELKDKLN